MKGSVEQDRQRRVLDWSDGPGQDVVSTGAAGILALLYELLVLRDPQRWSRLQRTQGETDRSEGTRRPLQQESLHHDDTKSL